jgi:hypothetical protein
MCQCVLVQEANVLEHRVEHNDAFPFYQQNFGQLHQCEELEAKILPNLNWKVKR